MNNGPIKRWNGWHHEKNGDTEWWNSPVDPNRIPPSHYPQPMPALPIGETGILLQSGSQNNTIIHKLTCLFNHYERYGGDLANDLGITDDEIMNLIKGRQKTTSSVNAAINRIYSSIYGTIAPKGLGPQRKSKRNSGRKK